jgi:hypothetical protein
MTCTVPAPVIKKVLDSAAAQQDRDARILDRWALSRSPAINGVHTRADDVRSSIAAPAIHRFGCVVLGIAASRLRPNPAEESQFAVEPIRIARSQFDVPFAVVTVVGFHSLTPTF